MDLALVAPDDGENMVAHAGEERLAIGGLAVRALEDPGRRLPVPHESVADDLHLAIAAEPHVAVLCLEGVMICCRMHVLELEQVLRGDLVELLRDDLDGGRIDEVALALVDCDADHHTVRRQIFQRDVLTRGDRQEGRHGSREGQSRSDEAIAASGVAELSEHTARILTGAA